MGGFEMSTSFAVACGVFAARDCRTVSYARSYAESSCVIVLEQSCSRMSALLKMYGGGGLSARLRSLSAPSSQLSAPKTHCSKAPCRSFALLRRGALRGDVRAFQGRIASTIAAPRGFRVARAFMISHHGSECSSGAAAGFAAGSLLAFAYGHTGKTRGENI